MLHVRRTGMTGWFWTAGVGLALTAGCGPTEPGPGEYAEARARWERRRPHAYEMELRRLCYCASSVQPVRLVVDGEVVTERVFVQDGQAVPTEVAELYPSVDGLFAVIADAMDRDAHDVEVTYDPFHGAPLEISIDYAEFVIDEELSFSVQGLTPLGG